MLQIALDITKKMYSDEADGNKDVRKNIEKHGGIEAVAKSDAEAIVNNLYKVSLGEIGKTVYFQPFITSFCGHKDKYEQENGILSQWRAYGKESGYMIAFDVKGLAELLEGEAKKWSYDTVYFTDVVYDDSDTKFKNEFADLINAMHVDIPK